MQLQTCSMNYLELEDPKRYQSVYDKQKMHPMLATKEELKMIFRMSEK